ncbi:midnolin-B [Aphis craccivora]|uniref:Midnolin-B n=1 Tax=Aphis craccivora TaxID=307492 RepID=A0A6G0YP47_APHCR|nr:midnolin-B [Aphis craccivora]
MYYLMFVNQDISICTIQQLRDGSLDDNQLMQGSRLTLLPSVETGLLVSKSSFSSLLSRSSHPLPLDDKPYIHTTANVHVQGHLIAA